MKQSKRYKFNPKREILECTPNDIPFLEYLYAKVTYTGNPQHKKNPGKFGLNPPSDPRAMKSLCDEVFVFTPSKALSLLKRGIERGLISVQKTTIGFPKNIWSVIKLKDGKEVPLEAQLENPHAGTYHGYPLPKTDPMHEKVLEKWRTSKCLISK